MLDSNNQLLRKGNICGRSSVALPWVRTSPVGSQATISERADDVQLSISDLKKKTAKASNCDAYETENINAIVVIVSYGAC
jgi:hypothetical protein